VASQAEKCGLLATMKADYGCSVRKLRLTLALTFRPALAHASLPSGQALKVGATVVAQSEIVAASLPRQVEA